MVFATLFVETTENQDIKEFEGVVKKAPNGKPVHRSNLAAILLDESGTPARQDKNVTLALITPVEVQPGTYYALSGNVFVTPYNNAQNRVALSIIADSVTPAK